MFIICDGSSIKYERIAVKFSTGLGGFSVRGSGVIRGSLRVEKAKLMGKSLSHTSPAQVGWTGSSAATRFVD